MLFSNLVSFLPAIVVADSIDVSFVFDDPDLNTDIKGTDDGLSEEIEGYYDLSGVKLSGLVCGITIVKYKDGHCVKLYK